MKTRMLTMALLVAAMLGASMSASAKGRKGECVRCRKGDVRKEIVLRKGNFPRGAEFRKMEGFKAFKAHDARCKGPKFRDMRFEAKRFKAAGKHGPKRRRR